MTCVDQREASVRSGCADDAGASSSIDDAAIASLWSTRRAAFSRPWASSAAACPGGWGDTPHPGAPASRRPGVAGAPPALHIPGDTPGGPRALLAQGLENAAQPVMVTRTGSYTSYDMFPGITVGAEHVAPDDRQALRRDHQGTTPQDQRLPEPAEAADGEPGLLQDDLVDEHAALGSASWRPRASTRNSSRWPDRASDTARRR